MYPNNLPKENHPNLKKFNIAFVVISILLALIGFGSMQSSSSAGYFGLLGVLGICSYIYVQNKTVAFTYIDNGVPSYVKLLCWLNAILGLMYGYLVIYIIWAVLFSVKENS